MFCVPLIFKYPRIIFLIFRVKFTLYLNILKLTMFDNVLYKKQNRTGTALQGVKFGNHLSKFILGTCKSKIVIKTKLMLSNYFII